STLVSKAAYRDIVRVLVNRIVLSTSYDRAANRRAGIKEMYARPGGSVLIATPDPTAPTKVCEEIMDAVGPEFLDELGRQLGSSKTFEDELNALAEKSDGGHD
ncbi:MAG TPA: hypothetical protein VGS23_06815, partial [Thermoplasmata archaeon]|nr:hypothetical protein [Thermoplasmata archaeon]